MTNIGPTSRPSDIFAEWIGEAQKTPGIHEPLAMTVATQGKNGDLHARVVLWKQWTEAGFIFFSNYQSRKGLDLEHNAQAAAVFYWDPLARQVNISGTVSKTSRAVSEKYWQSRPRESQLSQCISKQSQKIPNREALVAACAEAERRFLGHEIPCPEHWGGYLLSPSSIEFWVSRPGRLHDRFYFEKAATGWTFHRLAP